MAKKIISFRIDEESIKKLNELVNIGKTTRSKMIEECINAYYSYQEKLDKEKIALQNRIKELENYIKTKETLEDICKETIAMKDKEIERLRNEIKMLEEEIKELKEKKKKRKFFKI